MKNPMIDKIETFSCVQATNKKALIDYCDTFIPGDYLVNNPDAYYLVCYINDCSCKDICVGGEVRYKTKEDIPNKSVPCPCGKHWFIKYDSDTENITPTIEI